MTYTTNPVEAKLPEILFITQYVPVYTPNQDMTITHIFSLKISIYKLTIKKIRVISWTQNNEVYNVINKKRAGKVYNVLSINNTEENMSHSNDYIQQDLATQEKNARSYI